MMLKRRIFIFFWMFLLCSLPLLAQDTSDNDTLFSPSVGQKFYEIAYEMNHSKDVTAEQKRQALIFLAATAELDSRANYILPEMITLVSQQSDKDYSGLMHNLLKSYVDETADLEITDKAISYLLNRMNSREEREQLLAELLQNLGNKNMTLNSELATLLGALAVEKTDTDASSALFAQAFTNNRYNRLAFEKLSEVMAGQIPPFLRIDYLRSALGENPLDMEAAMTFAQYAEQLQLYQIAADAYQYCADLFSYFYPNQTLPGSIYLPWMINCYNTKRNQYKCLQIAEQLQQQGRFDLLAEAIAGKAAKEIGKPEKANQIFTAAENKALKLLAEDSTSDYQGNVTTEQLAWFYCFALPQAPNALDWANKAYSNDPNSPSAAAILAYSLVMNEQTDWAKSIIQGHEQDQIAALALAQIQLKEGQKDLAFETLNAAIKKDPGSLEAQRAKEILTTNGGEYITEVDTEGILTVLRERFEERIVPAFARPENIISTQLRGRGDKFYYGSEFGAALAIKNNSSQPLVISNNALLKGNIRIDVKITGDIKKNLPNLISLKIRPASPIRPGSSLLVPLQLVTGELRRTLLTYPQASMDIEFTAYLEPVTGPDGQVANGLTDVKPAKMTVKRPRVELNREYLQNRLNSIKKGRQGQKIKAAQLFAGLLAEQHAMANREPLYKFIYADWIPALLKSALVQNLSDDDWVVKTHTMAAILPLPMDFELTNAVAKNLNEIHWPARVMAIYLLAKKQPGNFTNVLDWTAKYDSTQIVRDMAIAFGAAGPQINENPSQSSTNESEKQPPADA